MECIKQTMETAGSCAMFSSEPVPASMILIQGKVRREEWEAGGERAGRPDLRGHLREENSQAEGQTGGGGGHLRTVLHLWGSVNRLVQGVKEKYRDEIHGHHACMHARAHAHALKVCRQFSYQ